MEEKKKFVVTRGMVLIGVILLLVIFILLIIFVKPKKTPKKSKVSISDCKKLEERIKEEAPMYIYQRNIELTGEPIKIDLSVFLSKNGGTIVESNYKAIKVCKGYVVAYKSEKEEYKGYVSCDKIYTTEGYVSGDNKVTITTSKKKEADTEKPIVTVVGDAVIELTVGSTYNDQGAKATDNIDGDITSNIKVSGAVDTTKPGEYIIKYTVSDSSNNVGEAQRKIIVKSAVTTTQKNVSTQQNKTTAKTTTTKTIPPTIVLKGDKVISINAGGTYLDPGYTAYDSKNNDLTSSVVVSGSVNTKVAGTYTLTYSVTDKNGNGATTTRTIIVKGSTVIEVKYITLTPNSFELYVGKTRKLEVSINPSNATNKDITWTSNDNSVATVSSDGTITARKKGSAKITAKTNNGKSSYSIVTVK